MSRKANRPLVKKCRDMNPLMAKLGLSTMRVITDVSGERYWTLVVEAEVPSLQAIEDKQSPRGSPEDMKEFERIALLSGRAPKIIFVLQNMMTMRALPLAPATVPGTVAHLDALFKAFADPTRLRIMNVLAAGELCVCDIVEILGLPQPTISRHLALLRREGLVEVSREWKYAHYRLVTPRDAVHRRLIGCVRSCFDGIEPLGGERDRAAARADERAADPC